MFTNSLQDAIANLTQDWITSHPTLAWMLEHPLWTIGLIFLALLLFWGLLQAIVRFMEQVWLLILQAPLKLVRSLFGTLFSLFKPAALLQAAKPEAQQNPQSRLSEILDRLEALRQEQEALMQEMRSILASDHVATKT